MVVMIPLNYQRMIKGNYDLQRVIKSHNITRINQYLRTLLMYDYVNELGNVIKVARSYERNYQFKMYRPSLSFKDIMTDRPTDGPEGSQGRHPSNYNYHIND